MTRARKASAALALLAGLLLAPPAHGAERWSLRGAGWGHGVGMSQYGAYGLARHGTGYRDILAHYYNGTRVEQRDGETVRVLLQPNRSTVYFRGASDASGRHLRPASLYKATRDGAEVVLRSSSGRELRRYPGLMRVTGDGYLRLSGTADNGVRNGVYRGAFEIRTAIGPGLNAINAVGLESYVLGVVPNESPSGWPAAALEAQAVAARTYALATGANGRGFDQYADTRSQVYRVRRSETLQASAAVAATAGEVVTYGGEIAVTYFFSTSGGYTENVENVFGGSAPKPWLQGVDDPYDDASPYHRWGPYSFTRRGLAAKLGRWVNGRFKSFRVLKRGVSPRVLTARVRGTRGTVVVTGPQVRARLGLRDTWFYVRRVSSSVDGGALASAASGAARPKSAIRGSVAGYRGKTVKLQRLDHGKWRTLFPVKVRTGRYRADVPGAGDYRVLAGWAVGPKVRVAPRSGSSARLCLCVPHRDHVPVHHDVLSTLDSKLRALPGF